jgi:single-strand DNA-binding protein
MNLNRATIIGNLTRDPESKTLPSGQTVVNFSIATSYSWKDSQTGEKKEQTEFHNIQAWRKLGEICAQYLKKGSKIFLEGRIQTRSWDDQNGVKHYKTEIIADNMIMLDRLGATNNAGQNNNSQNSSYQASAPAQEEIQIENIPF